MLGLVKKDKIKKVVRKFPRKEVEIERVLYVDVHPRITLYHPRVKRIIRDSIHMDPILLNLALEHTHTLEFESEKLGAGDLKEYISPSAQDALKYHLLFQLAMLKLIKEHEDEFRIARINAEKLGDISKKAIREHATVKDVHAANLEVLDAVPDALEEAYLIKSFKEFASDDNIPKIAETLASELAKEGIHVDKGKIEEAFRRAKPVVESLVREAYMDPTHEIVSDKMDKHQYILHGIERNKEFRQFLVEISGEKIEEKPAKLGGDSREKARRTSLPTELIAIAKALEYSNFSREAMKRAEEDLLRLIDELLENPEENALEIAYTVKLLRLVQRGKTEEIRGFAK